MPHSASPSRSSGRLILASSSSSRRRTAKLCSLNPDDQTPEEKNKDAVMNSANPRAGNLGYWCSASAAQFPDKVARIDLASDPARETPYAELERRLDRV